MTPEPTIDKDIYVEVSHHVFPPGAELRTAWTEALRRPLPNALTGHVYSATAGMIVLYLTGRQKPSRNFYYLVRRALHHAWLHNETWPIKSITDLDGEPE